MDQVLDRYGAVSSWKLSSLSHNEFSWKYSGKDLNAFTTADAGKNLEDCLKHVAWKAFCTIGK